MEDPGYPGAFQAFQSAGARVIPIPVDRGACRFWKLYSPDESVLQMYCPSISSEYCAECCFSKTLPDSTVVAPFLPWKAVYRQACRNGRQFSHELPRNAEDNGLSNDDFRPSHSSSRETDADYFREARLSG